MRLTSRRPLLPVLSFACLAGAVVLLCFAHTAGARAEVSGEASAIPATLSGDSQAKPSDAATLEQCITSGAESERSATFAGEISMIPNASKMEMRIEVLERMPHESLYRTVSAPGLGVWRSSAPGVKVYKYLKQVTNLSAPASYRAAVRFRWLGAKGKIIKTAELRTPRCDQPAPPRTEVTPETPSPPAGTAPVGG
jgi:hypothetical protein